MEGEIQDLPGGKVDGHAHFVDSCNDKVSDEQDEKEKLRIVKYL
jgi:hypothetical protein